MTEQATIYRSIHKIPMGRFLDAFLDEDLSALVIEGNPSENDLKEAWAPLKEDFLEAFSGSENEDIVEHLAQMYRLSLKIEMGYTAISILEKLYQEDLATKLNKICTVKLVWNYSDREGYKRNLATCLRHVQNMEELLKIRREEFDRMQKERGEQSKGAQFSREYFDDWFEALSDHAKREINDTITAYRFCRRVKKYLAYCEQLQLKKAGGQWEE